MKDALTTFLVVFVISFLISYSLLEKKEKVILETTPCKAPQKEGEATTGKLVRKDDGSLWLMCIYENHKLDLKHTR